MSNGRVLVLGGLGFIGSHICRFLLREDYHVRVFDKLYASNRLVSDIVDQLDIVQGDMQRPDDVISALQEIDIAIDLVHTTVPGSSMKDPGYDVESNVAAHAKWLSRLGETTVKRLIYISSGGTVYGIPQTNPISEDHPTNPISSYGITKLAIEKYVAMYSMTRGIKFIVCRPSNVYGEGQRLNIGQGVIGVFLARILRGAPIEIWGDGEISRDYLHVSDLAAAVIELISYNGIHNVFNISSGRGYSLNQICELMERTIGTSLKIIYKSKRKFDVKTNVLDNRRLSEETGWRARVELTEGIRRVFDYMRGLKAVETI